MPTRTVYVKASNKGEQCDFCTQLAKYAINSRITNNIFANTLRILCCQMCSQQIGFELRKADRRMNDGEEDL